MCVCVRVCVCTCMCVKLSRDPIFSDGQSTKISQSNFRGWTFKKLLRPQYQFGFAPGESGEKLQKWKRLAYVVPAGDSETAHITEAITVDQLSSDKQQAQEAHVSIWQPLILMNAHIFMLTGFCRAEQLSAFCSASIGARLSKQTVSTYHTDSLFSY